MEAAASQSHPSLRTDGAAAFSIEDDGTEQLIVVQELDFRAAASDEAFASVAQAVFAQAGSSPDVIVLVKAGSIPRTSSGKIRRRQCRADLQQEALPVVARWERSKGPAREPLHPETAAPTSTAPSLGAGADEAQVAGWVRGQLAARYGLAPGSIDEHQPFAFHGLTSIHAVEMAGLLQAWLGRPVPPTVFWDHPTLAELSAHLGGAQSIPTAASQPSAPERTARHEASEPIAIIGLGCRFPGADGPAAFWRLLRDGVDAVREAPAGRHAARTFDNPHPHVPQLGLGGFLDQVDRFDAAFFGIAPREAVHLDPQQRLVMEVAWEALENAALAPGQLAHTDTGVFIGISTSDHARRQPPTPDGLNLHAATGNAASIAANRLSYLWDLQGPSMAVDTACSSSLVAVHLACQSLREGESTLAIAGGVNVMLSTDASLPFAQAGMLAADGRCKTFDQSADGYVRGEGCGIVVLKRLVDAQRDGDPIHALILGSATGQDGRSNGLTAPNGQGPRPR